MAQNNVCDDTSYVISYSLWSVHGVVKVLS